MKLSNYFLTFVIIFILGRASVKLFDDKYDNMRNIDLPEEYKLNTKEDNLKGYFDKDSTLVIYFANPDNALVKPEYIMELDGDSVFIQTPDNKVLRVHWDKMQDAILDDNL